MVIDFDKQSKKDASRNFSRFLIIFLLVSLFLDFSSANVWAGCTASEKSNINNLCSIADKDTDNCKAATQDCDQSTADCSNSNNQCINEKSDCSNAKSYVPPNPDVDKICKGADNTCSNADSICAHKEEICSQKGSICDKQYSSSLACSEAKKCRTPLVGNGACQANGNNDTENKCSAAATAQSNCTEEQKHDELNISAACDEAARKVAICNAAQRCDDASKQIGTKKGSFSGAYCPFWFDGTFITHYGIWNGPFPNTDSTMILNQCIGCWVYVWPIGCVDKELGLKHSWGGDFAYCLMADYINPSLMCLINNLRPSLEIPNDVKISAEPTDNYYRDLCISGADLKTGDLSANTGLYKSTTESEIYGEKSVGFVTGAKPLRGSCMALPDLPELKIKGITNAEFSYYQNANNVDLKTNGVDAAGKNGEYKSSYGDTQNLYKSSTFPIGNKYDCPADISGNTTPKNSIDWKDRMVLCYDYYILQRAAHPEWSLERAGDNTDNPLTKYSAVQAIFDSCQPLMSGNNGKSLIGGFSPVLQYPNRPDLDEADYEPSKYLKQRWSGLFQGKNEPGFQNLFPCLVQNSAADSKRNWDSFNKTVIASYATIAVIECLVLYKKCEGPVWFTPIETDKTHNSPGVGKADFCPNVEKINDPVHPFSPRDMLFKKASYLTSIPVAENAHIALPIETPDLTPFSHKYGTDRGYSWETSSIVPIPMERFPGGTYATAAPITKSVAGISVIQAPNYTDYANPKNLADIDKVVDMIKHPPVQCAIVPVDILESRRKQFDACIMQRIQYNYHTWRFNNFADYYGFKDYPKTWTPPCKTRFYEHDDVSDCPVQFSIQQCCRIIVKDVVPLNYVKIRTCEGLRQKRNLILGFDHIYDDDSPSKGGKRMKVTDQASYDEAAKINQKLSFIGCDGTEPEDYTFLKYFQSDVKLDSIKTSFISDAIGGLRNANNFALKTALTEANSAFKAVAQPEIDALISAKDASDKLVGTAKKTIDTKVTQQVINASIKVSNAERDLASAKAAVTYYTKQVALNVINANAKKTAQDYLSKAISSVATATTNYGIAIAEEKVAKEAEALAYKGLYASQDVENKVVNGVQSKVNQLIETEQSKLIQAIEKAQKFANKEADKGYKDLKNKIGNKVSSQIDKLLEQMDKTKPPLSTLIISGSHMPYMRWWDTGTSAGNPSHGGSFINTLGSYDVIIGVGREERSYEDAQDSDVKKHLDETLQPLTQKNQIGRIESWEGIKGHQMWTTRKNNLVCIGRTEKLFKPYGAENFVLARAGTKYDTKTQNLASGIKPKDTDNSGQTYPWPLGWRGFVNEGQFSGNVPNGLDNAEVGDIIVFNMSGMNQIAYVSELSLGGVRIESWDQGKFPTAAGVSIASGNIIIRTIYKDSVPKDYKDSLSLTKAATNNGQPSCEDQNYTACVLPDGVWNSVQIYRPRSDNSRVCPYAPNILQTEKIDTNIWTKCVNDGYDPPMSLRRLDGYKGVGTGAKQDTTLCGAKWGSCSTTADKTTFFPSGCVLSGGNITCP